MSKSLKETPSQTAGPYVHIGCTLSFAGVAETYGTDLGAAIPSDAIGTRIRIQGRIFDGNDEPLSDAMVETWQADGSGRYGIWLRQATDLSTGHFRFHTVKPVQPDEAAPHLSLWLVARGINLGLSTRVYFPDEDNAADPLLAQAGERRDTLIAVRLDEDDVGVPIYRFDIRLQGEQETVFIDT